MNDLQKYYLLESAKWQKLLGVLMWICTIFMVLLGLFFIVTGILGLDLGDESALEEYTDSGTLSDSTLRRLIGERKLF